MHAGRERWWSGPLDVERLARAAVGAARVAAMEVAASRGRDCVVGTSPALTMGAFSALDRLRVDGRRPVTFAPLSGFFPTGDSWVRTHANYPHHAAALERALGAKDRHGLVRALRA